MAFYQIFFSLEGNSRLFFKYQRFIFKDVILHSFFHFMLTLTSCTSTLEPLEALEGDLVIPIRESFSQS